MSLATMIATALHAFEPNPHPISLVIPPLTAIVCLSLLLYLIKYPQQIYRVIKISIGWSSFIFIFPEYFFVIEAFLDPKKRLVDTLPPISSGIFLLTTIMIVFLRPRGLVRLVFLLWVVTAAPVVVYLIFHPSELETPRGMDLMITLAPAMAVNLSLLLFYTRLQDAIDKLYIERFHLQEVSEKDALTSVFNRGAGERILQNLIDRSELKIGIILCDIDYFKQVNDRYGHLMGDRVLQLFARCCQAHLRKTDTLIRWGGEEFLIVVTGDDEQELEHLAERLRAIVAGQEIPEVGKVTASFGVALLHPQENLIQLFVRADQALYQAKKSGRNQVVIA
ncbi:MAG: GGDEF domain-containing protein [Pseudanabaena sp. RU_4_16]|nr:GGDEF domain-containing protein [Pseudanabaena sp. RU_4_16]